jgi:ribosome biogenesis protein Nip4
MIRKIENIEKEIEKQVQRNNLFRTLCKTKDRVCKVIVESGRTYVELQIYHVNQHLIVNPGR